MLAEDYEFGVLQLGRIEVQSMQDDNVALVQLSMNHDSKDYYATGSSKRAQGDKRNAAFGFKLALVRALADLQTQVLGTEGYFFED